MLYKSTQTLFLWAIVVCSLTLIPRGTNAFGCSWAPSDHVRQYGVCGSNPNEYGDIFGGAVEAGSPSYDIPHQMKIYPACSSQTAFCCGSAVAQGSAQDCASPAS